MIDRCGKCHKKYGLYSIKYRVLIPKRYNKECYEKIRYQREKIICRECLWILKRKYHKARNRIIIRELII
jgi:hypothetical protein